MSGWGTPLEKRDTCRYCGTPFGDRAHHNRQHCSKQCREKEVSEKRAAARASSKTGDDYHAGRTHGNFFIPAVEQGQSKSLNESFFCWYCHKEHKPKDVAHTLGLKCECGFTYVFTIGVAEDGSSHIVRVDRLS